MMYFIDIFLIYIKITCPNGALSCHTEYFHYTNITLNITLLLVINIIVNLLC